MVGYTIVLKIPKEQFPLTFKLNVVCSVNAAFG